MNHTESDLQINCVNWFHLQFPKLHYHFFSVPNGGKRVTKMVKTKMGYRITSPEAARMKREGAKSGVSDLILLVPNDEFSFLCIEMKAPKGTQTDNQKAFEQEISRFGFGKYVICRNFDSFKKEVEDYLQSTQFGKLL